MSRLIHTRLTATSYLVTIDEDGEHVYDDVVEIEAWGETLMASMQAARWQIPDGYQELTSTSTAHEHVECCQCVDGRQYAVSHVALCDGMPWCYDCGVKYCGLDGSDYPAYRVDCAGCRVVCDAREADNNGGYCTACACAREVLDRYDYEESHGAGSGI